MFVQPSSEITFFKSWESFSPHSVPNPDQASEHKLLGQLVPELPEDVIHRLVGVFQDLCVGH